MIEAIPEGSCQDVQGRLWDVVWMALAAARRNPGKDTYSYQMLMDRIEGGKPVRDLWLKMVVGPVMMASR